VYERRLLYGERDLFDLLSDLLRTGERERDSEGVSERRLRGGEGDLLARRAGEYDRDREGVYDLRRPRPPGPLRPSRSSLEE
jgi:hypothetical protein